MLLGSCALEHLGLCKWMTSRMIVSYALLLRVKTCRPEVNLGLVKLFAQILWHHFW